jgi:cobalamin biosynthesis protein CobD/CbiB
MSVAHGIIGPLTIKEIRRCGLTLAELSRFTSISYSRLYRACTGSTDNLEPDELHTVRRALALALSRDPSRPGSPLSM